MVTNHKLREHRKENNLCRECGLLKEQSDKSACNKCLKKCKLRQQMRQEQLKKNKQCLQCGKRLEDNDKSYCKECKRKHNINAKNIIRIAIENRVCYRCKGNIDITGTLCKACWLKRKARDYLGKSSMWTILDRKLEEQKYKCAYTGRKLVLGVNASIDHKTPICRGGGRSSRNLQWVLRDINLMKNNRTDKEFVYDIKTIAVNLGISI